MATSTDLKMDEAQMHKLDSILNSSGVDPAVYRAWIVQEGNEWFFIPEGLLNAQVNNSVPALLALAGFVANST